MDSDRGLAKTASPGTVTLLATQPPAMKMTSSPGLTPVTSAPARVTVPLASMPIWRPSADRS